MEPGIALLGLLRAERERLQNRLTETARFHDTLDVLAGPILRAGATPRREVGVEIVTGLDRVRLERAAISESVAHDRQTMHTGAVGREESEHTLDEDRRQLARGVRVRAMYGRRAGSVPDMAQHLRARAELGVEIRTSPVVPMNMLLADENFALLPTDLHDPAAGTIVARGAALVGSYLALYEYCWQCATPYGEDSPADRGGAGLSEQQVVALHMLASGVKDEEIARNLGVSLRTASRLLSEVMQELGAASRFEAGVKAARLGWLDAKSGTSADPM
ncbi:helix-turn-helix transcriptional regulator [Streptomyces sp. H27-H1]|uniref:helix-turn-helix transcriptional regulator n=1 Tax=Streptomyces sp. H27-H1 TaxID=2996461 RepID=UPI002270793C|nr:helix-turn-helix transcriptional regulator [Streptomyces sp. H27-H1]MCY0928839.1 helix-turn-helix transcriptional regulator [Streptomyces sp. H27-H1]